MPPTPREVHDDLELILLQTLSEVAGVDDILNLPVDLAEERLLKLADGLEFQAGKIREAAAHLPAIRLHHAKTSSLPRTVRGGSVPQHLLPQQVPHD